MSDKKEILELIMGDMKSVEPQFSVNVCNALREEFDAVNTYTLLRDTAPDTHTSEIMQEILNDECNHIGRLLDILQRTMPPEQIQALTAGLKQEEPTT